MDTTPGRARLADLLPDNPNITFDLVNKLMTKKEITNVIDTIYRHCGQKDTVIFVIDLWLWDLAKRVNGISLGIVFENTRS